MPNLPKLSHLKIDRPRGAAPHKPLLLLCLLEFAEEGALTRGIMPITGELAFRFSRFWSVVAHRRPQRPDLKLPLVSHPIPADLQHGFLFCRCLGACYI
jgi:putative restriction endonuclease